MIGERRPNPSHRMPNKAELAEAARQIRKQSHDYRRDKIVHGRVAALDDLHRKLTNAALLYDSSDLQLERNAVAHALLAVAEYLQGRGFSLPTLEPLMRPYIALVDRENNNPDLMFSESRSGRPKATAADHQRKGILAALAESWLRAHKDDGRLQRAKLSVATRYLKQHLYPDLTPAELKSARDFVAQSAKDHPAVQTARKYEAVLEEYAQNLGAEEAFKSLVELLIRLKPGGEGQISESPPVSPIGDD